MNDKPIVIISGEGEVGTVETFHGKKTKLAVKRRLNRERSHDRWARAIQFSHKSVYGAAGVDVESGELVSFPDSALPEEEN